MHQALGSVSFVPAIGMISDDTLSIKINADTRVFVRV